MNKRIGLVAGLLVIGWARGAWTDQPQDTEKAPTSSQERAAPEAAAAAPAPDAGGTASSKAPAASAGLVSVDFKEADIRQVLRVISLKSGVDIVAGSDVEGLVTIKLTNVPWEEALEIILRTYGFTYEHKGRVVRVMTIKAEDAQADPAKKPSAAEWAELFSLLAPARKIKHEYPAWV